jgi:hypothetical protein
MTVVPPVTLEEARDWLRARVEDGDYCPCCTQFAKVYKRKINSGMVRALINLYRAGGPGRDFRHLPPIDPSHGDAAKLVYWELIEEEPVVREDGGRAGWWRVTPLGEDFLRGWIKVIKYARVYDSRLLGFTGGKVDVRDALGTKFKLDDLMEGL